MSRPASPSIRALLRELPMPRWYLMGELSDPEDLELGLTEIGVGWRVVPATGHPMGIQNPLGFATTVAGVLAEAWAAT